MRRHVLAVYVRFDTSLFSLGVTDLNYMLKIIEIEFVSKRPNSVLALQKDTK